MTRKSLARNTMYTLLCAAFVVLAGCSQSPAPAPGPASPSSSGSTPAPAQSAAGTQAYTPPSADQLYQMVAPIALFPDKLVAQVLAASTYPDQITAADNVVTQNPNLTGASLQTAIAQQPWDASVKGLTAFPSVLDQMAKNIDWTAALGDAYVNDPTDVMNAIQVMRQRASKHGNLRSSAQLSVTTQAESAPPPSYADSGDNGYPVYSGAAVVPPPGQIIEIAPAQSDTVYVPQYNPETVYGEQTPYYPGYTYAPQPQYSTGEVVTVGALSFGAGILIGALFEHHHDRQNYGWQNWGMNWGSGRGGNNGGGWQRPAVVYNNSTYVSRSTTVVNRYVTNNVNNSRTINNINNSVNNSNNQTVQNRNFNNHTTNHPAAALVNGRPAAAAASGGASMPHFGPTPAARPIQGPQGNRGLPGAPEAARANVAGAAHAPMSMPHFDATPQRGVSPQQAAHTAASAPNHAVRANEPRMPATHAPAAAMPAHANAMRSMPTAQQPPREAAPAEVHVPPARPMMEHTSPAVRPVEAPRPAAPRPQQAAPHPQAAPRPAPAPPPQARPAPAVHPVAHPAPPKPRKDDKDNQGHR